MKKLTHTDDSGKARMVDVSAKKESHRAAQALAEVHVGKRIIDLIRKNKMQKGDVFTVAKIAGIQAVKRTSEIIPLCHNILITDIDIEFLLNEINSTIEIKSLVKSFSVTGVEMEALTAVAMAALTIYDMCKSVSKSIRINNIHLLSKTGGKSGNYFEKK